MSRTTQDWQAADAAHFLHPFTDFDALAKKGSRIIERAENIYLWDSEGHKILDAMSGLWCVNVGYGRQELIDAATAQLKQLPFYNAFFQTATPPAIELAELLSEVTPPQFRHVFFSGSGSEGNDTVVRMVRRYWDVLGQPERKVIISRNNAYHGSTMAGAALGGKCGQHPGHQWPAAPGHQALVRAAEAQGFAAGEDAAGEWGLGQSVYCSHTQSLVVS